MTPTAHNYYLRDQRRFKLEQKNHIRLIEIREKNLQTKNSETREKLVSHFVLLTLKDDSMGRLICELLLTHELDQNATLTVKLSTIAAESYVPIQ